MDIRKSRFTHNFIAPHRLSWLQMVRSTALGAFFFYLIPNMVQKQIIARFIDVVFQNNTSILGGAFFFYVRRRQTITGNLNIRFIRCQFTDNQARMGGAINVWFPHYFRKDFLQILPQVDKAICFLHCIFKNNMATNHTKGDVMKRHGGAVFCHNFAVNISDSTMVNNYAASSGGSLHDASCIIHLVRTIIRIDKRLSELTFHGQAIYSRGTLIMKDMRIDMRTPILRSTKIPYVWMTGPQFGILMTPHAVPQRVNLTCSTGNDIVLEVSKVKYFTMFANMTKAQPTTVVNRLQFRCLPCPKSFYSLDFDRATLLNSLSSKIYNVKCSPCPHGGDCSCEIKAKANFWGFRSESQDANTISFLPCPKDYCCQGENCLTFNSCNENRKRILCGQCRKGYVCPRTILCKVYKSVEMW